MTDLPPGAFRRPPARRSSDPAIVVPPDVLARHDARVLDPVTAAQRPGQTVRSTVYVAGSLLVRGAGPEFDVAVPPTVQAAADAAGLTVTFPPERSDRRRRFIDVSRRHGVKDPDLFFPARYDLAPKDGAAGPVDAWQVVQNFRAQPANRAFAEGGLDVALNHLLTANRHTHGSPLDAPDAAFGRAGYGLRIPVSWTAELPVRQPDDAARRRPVVAVLDTGCGTHPWLDPFVTTNPTLDTELIGLAQPPPGTAGDSETDGMVDRPLAGELDADSGHGTFIAGLIRQACPDADLLSIRVMSSDGAVPEHVLLDALGLLVARQQRFDPTLAIDVVSLSLGYYHEEAEDVAFDQPLEAALNALSALGVAVVVAAGNDATDRPMFPAAFALHAGAAATADPPRVPLASVGARNPSGATTAIFSNAGAWVTCHRPGANLVSTMPPINGGGQPDVAVGSRASLDPDDFRGGFAVWSGTSFAAPLCAGEIAQALYDGTHGDLSSLEPPASVARAAAASHAVTNPPAA